MVSAYMMAGLIPEYMNKKGFLLVLGSANLDEGLRGYLTKYDCSSADVNPIGSISKTDINKFLMWNYEKRGIQAAKQILEAVPTAELRPLDNKNQIA
jgi:NAD+ synthase (glutamine-hydrolysing)